jgi:Flp pilus assembly protein TadD
MNALPQTQQAGHQDFSALLRAGWQAFENSGYEEALALFRKAAVADLKKPEPWHAMGLVHERLGQKKSAGYAYYMACDMQAGFAPARQALKRLGFLDIC